MPKLGTAIRKLYKVGPTMESRFKRLGIGRVVDLLFHFPTRYEDWSQRVKIKNLGKHVDKMVAIEGEITNLEGGYNRYRRLAVITAEIEDETGGIEVVWYNQKYLMDSLSIGDKICVVGKVQINKRSKSIGLTVNNYELMRTKKRIHTGRIVPVYSETRGLSSKYIRFHMWEVLSSADELKEYLPKEILKSRKLISLAKAVKQIHFPEDEKEMEEARRRLAFDELFLIQLYTGLERKKWHDQKAHANKIDDETLKKFTDSLPFELTKAQKKSSWQILQDLEKDDPMNRLLEGDVGSGKTVVAAMAGLNVIKSGHQVALMAPTDILAKQHFNSLNELLAPFGVRIGLLTGKGHEVNTDKFGLAQKSGEGEDLTKKKILGRIKDGEVDLIIGTHALIQAKVTYGDLALQIIDEQHRFGVSQRADLQKRYAVAPHLLTMTATPIPRTMALAVYGDLDLSILDEMPKGRKKILTKTVDPRNRDKAYDFIRERVAKGRQVFIICPLVSESEKIRVKAATEEHERLRKKVFIDLKVGLIHGKLKKKEKEEVMRKYSEREIDILVSTSVVEVGIDIPNATIIVIEGAERFGLAQLHQLRGRVGRGKHQSFCFLFTETKSDKTRERLNAMTELENGFELAEKDLELRGAGNIYGTEQSGWVSSLKIASLGDHKLIKEAKEEAQKIIEKDSQLKKYDKLKRRLKKFDFEIHFE